jgi:hypothetical protein
MLVKPPGRRRRRVAGPLAGVALAAACIAASAPARSQATVDWTRTIASAKQATILLRIETAIHDPAYASAFIVSNDGLALTARHVLPSDFDPQRDRITGLLGWDRYPIDFHQAAGLRVTYVSAARDLVLLRVEGLPEKFQPLCMADHVNQGQPVLLLAYPNGDVLTATDGIAAGPAPADEYRHSAGSGVGESGGPVLDTAGAVLGLHLAGRQRTPDGALQLGYFLPTVPIAADLAAHGQDGAIGHCTGGEQQAAAPAPNVNYAYAVELTKSDREGSRPTDRVYSLAFSALRGYRIEAARFATTSARHVVKDAETEIVKDGEAVAFRVTLESGPADDRWPGWVSGTVDTRQRLRQ